MRSGIWTCLLIAAATLSGAWPACAQGEPSTVLEAEGFRHHVEAFGHEIARADGLVRVVGRLP